MYIDMLDFIACYEENNRFTASERWFWSLFSYGKENLFYFHMLFTIFKNIFSKNIRSRGLSEYLPVTSRMSRPIGTPGWKWRQTWRKALWASRHDLFHIFGPQNAWWVAPKMLIICMPWISWSICLVRNWIRKSVLQLWKSRKNIHRLELPASRRPAPEREHSKERKLHHAVWFGLTD